jgi:hypothetical protein
MSKTAWIVISVIVLLLAIIGFIYWKNKPLLDKSAGAKKEINPTSTPASASANQNVSN